MVSAQLILCHFFVVVLSLSSERSSFIQSVPPPVTLNLCRFPFKVISLSVSLGCVHVCVCDAVKYRPWERKDTECFPNFAIGKAQNLDVDTADL